ncbi:MAG TPA: NADH-quinone oxidoreductase subunit NuoH [bacterium]|nr:NADH-quinone oxidoreductase subunit NuoH [bacterium]
MQGLIQFFQHIGLASQFWATVLSTIIYAAAVFGFLAVFALVAVYLERKVSGHMQDRLGPMRVGWHGFLQTVADTLKLLAKEDIIPRNADRVLFILAPVVLFVGTYLVFAALPFGPGIIGADLNIGLFYIIAVSSLVVIGIIMAGYSSNNKWSLYGGMRSAAQIVSYEIPVGLSLLIGVMMTETLNLGVMVQAQETGIAGLGGILGWNFIQNPFAFIAFFVYVVAGTAEANRTPFDLPEAESELVAGAFTEYSGMRWAFFFLAEYANMWIVAVLGAVVFLGGWNSPIPGDIYVPGIVWLFVKAFAIVFVQIWARWTFPRIRVDQLMTTCWKYLTPIAFFNLIGVGFWLMMSPF